MASIVSLLAIRWNNLRLHFPKQKLQWVVCWPVKNKQEEIFLKMILFLMLYFLVLTVETLPLLSTGASKINTIKLVALRDFVVPKRFNFVFYLLSVINMYQLNFQPWLRQGRLDLSHTNTPRCFRELRMSHWIKITKDVRAHGQTDPKSSIQPATEHKVTILTANVQ